MLLTVGDVADVLGVSRSTVRRLEAQGVMPERDSHGRRLYTGATMDQARDIIVERRRALLLAQRRRKRNGT